HYTTGGANNWGKYSNKEVDDLLTRANIESDQPKRRQLYSEASKILASTVAEVFHEFGTLRTAHSKKLQGFVEIPDGRFRLGRVVQGDLGRSVRTGRPVAEAIGARLGTTLELAALTTLVCLAIAIPAGTIAAARRNSGLDIVSTIVALLGVSLPNFFLGILL